MWYLSIFEAKEDTHNTDISRERRAWFEKGKDRVFEERCMSISRYEILGVSPLKIFFLIETDDAVALNMISRHFGDAWESVTYPVVRRDIHEALEEDHAIVAG